SHIEFAARKMRSNESAAFHVALESGGTAMKPLKFTLLPVLAAVAAAALVFPHAAAQPLTPDGGDDVEILTRGPVHEAFAEIVVFEPQPGLVIGSAPPEPIEELPPDQRPEGENIA